MGSKIIPDCPAMSGTAWETRLFLPDIEGAGDSLTMEGRAERQGEFCELGARRLTEE